MRYISYQTFVIPQGREGQPEEMLGVVTLLDDRHYARVEAIWEELRQKFDVRGLYVNAYPHFSFQVADSYDEAMCENFLRELAARTPPFRVRTAGLGIFTIVSPILYIPIVRSLPLTQLHREIWDGVKQSAPGAISHYYHPDEWAPHITLAQGDIDSDKLAEIVRLLSARNFHWEITVNNLAVIYDTGREQGIRCRFNFKQAAAVSSE